MKKSSIKHLWLLLLSAITICAFANPALAKSDFIKEKLEALEASSGGRLGISATNTGNGMHIEYRQAERFPMNCTSKVLAVAAVLRESMKNPSLLKKRIAYTKQDIDSAGWAPVTQKHLKDGMTISQLCKTAIMQSDNTAMNILMQQIGGIHIANRFLKSIGDNTSRFDRLWPAEASSIPGDLRDSSTPSAMENSFQKLVLGHTLAAAQHKQLLFWLKNSTTGYNRIRAGVPKGWSVGDKTGTGYYGTSNDIAIIQPPNCSPVTLAIYFTQNKKDAALREDVVVSATKLVIEELASKDLCIQSAMSTM